METKYAIQVTRETLDLIKFLNQGVRPEIEVVGEPLYFIFTPNEALPGHIERESELYDENGNSKDPNIHWIIG